MGGTFHFYLAAATALWEAPLARLEDLKAHGEPEALRRAAQDVLLMKAQFVTPETLGDERKAVTILAAALEEDPDFTLDLAMRVGGRRDNPGHGNPRPRVRYRTGARRWKVVVALAVAASVLVALEILANAGVPVPSPIDDVIDQLTEDEARGTITPDRSAVASRPSRRGDIVGSRLSATFATRPQTTHVRDRREVDAKLKNPNHANGRERNQANGRERNQANGRERNPKHATKYGNRAPRARNETGARMQQRAVERDRTPPRHRGRNSAKPRR